MESLARLSILTVFVVSSSVVHAGPTGDINGVETATALRLHPLLSCLRETDTTGCIQKRAFRYLEDWLVRGEEAAGLDRSDEDLATLPPYLARIIDSLADGISTWWTGGPDDDDARRLKATGSNSLEEEARGPKKKIHKAVKRAIIKLVLIAFLIKHKIKLLLHGFQTFVQLNFLLIAGAYVVANVIKVWAEIKHKHHPQKVVYYENAHHTHYDADVHHDHHYDEHANNGWGSGVWGRSIAVPSSTPPGIPAYAQASSYSQQPGYAHQLAYSGQVPSS